MPTIASMGNTKRLGELKKTEKEAIILQALQNAGYNQNEVAHLLDLSRQRVNDVHKAVKAGITDKIMFNKARRSLKLLLDGKLVGDMGEVKGSDIIGAIKLVAERVDPVVNKIESTHVNYDIKIKPEDRERFQKLLGMAPPVDAEFTVVTDQKQLPEEVVDEKAVESTEGDKLDEGDGSDKPDHEPNPV